MRKAITILILTLTCIMGYAQCIDPALEKEMERRRDNDKIRVFVIMKQHYDHEQLCRRAAHFTTRAEKREFVVNELKQFAEVSQYDLRHILAEMREGDMVSEPKTLWIANAISFEASRDAILSLADRTDIRVIGFDEERNWLPDGEESHPANPSREITSNVTQVNANQVWNLGYTGQGVVVAVIDTGVNYNHLDLADHLWDGGTEFPNHGYDVYNNDNDPIDDHGHGTHCAGTICGDGTAGSQTGMAPDATLMCVKCLDANGRCDDTQLITAMQWAVDHGCDVINMSLCGYGQSSAEKTLLRNTCVNVLTSGVIASIAGGNAGDALSAHPIPENIGLPGGCPPPYLDSVQELNPGGLSCSVCVGAVNVNDEASYFTSHGPYTWFDTDYADYPYIANSSTEFGLIRPDVCAPGVSIKSASFINNSGYLIKSGTSMATPCVAGCMALMLSKNHNATPEDLCRILEETAVPLSTGKSNIYGYGRVDVLAAINAMDLLPLILESFAVDDGQGNNDGKLNAGEAVTLDLTLMNNTNAAFDGAIMVLSTESEYVTITNGTATLPYFDAGQTQTVEDIFAFDLSDGFPGNGVIRFEAETFVDGESIGIVGISVEVYGHILRFDEVMVLNDDNANGILEAGETADLHVLVSNIGNEVATSIVGTLSTTFPFLTNNNDTIAFGDIEVNGQVFADFSVTLDSLAPEGYMMVFLLDLIDGNEKHSILDFELVKEVIVFDDPNVKSICVSHWDTNGDGELSYAEAAAVTDLGNTFYGNETITTFDELQYFTGLSSIGGGAFGWCSNLTLIVMPNSVTTIGNNAFEGCYSLTSISIPNSVTSVGIGAFESCSSLGQIIVDSGNMVYDSRNNCNAIIETSTNKLVIGCKNTVIPNSVTSIEGHAFWGCIGMTSITIPNSVTAIGDYVFKGCTGLTSVSIGNSVTYIGQSAFSYCIGLTSIVIPNSVTTIGQFAFSSCWGLTSVSIGNSVTSIEDYAFSSCKGLVAVEIPSSVTSIGYGAFKACIGLEQIIVDAGNMVYDSRNNCNAIIETSTNKLIMGCQNSSIPNSVTSIESDAFYYCSNLTSIIIPNSVTSIGDSAFNHCISLTSIAIPNSVTIIGQSAFDFCRAMTSLSLGNSVTSIGLGAFEFCSSLTSMTVLAEIPPTIASNVFYGVNKSIPVYVPYESVEVYQSVAYWNEFANIQERCMQSQTVSFSAGWSWWSPHLDITLDDLENALGSNGVMIKSQKDFNSYSQLLDIWLGGIVDIIPEQMYKVRVRQDCDIVLTGPASIPAYHTIIIKPGCNWIGFPTQQSIALEAAFANFTPANGDVIRSSDGFSSYSSAFGCWIGNLENIEPEKGYIYLSKDTVTKTLVFPD